LNFKKYSYRFAEQVLNSNLSIKNEFENLISSLNPQGVELSRPNLNKIFREKLIELDWQAQPPVFEDPKDPSAKLDFLKNRTGIEIQFGHSSFIGIDLLKFQVCSYSSLDSIDIGIYIVTTKEFQKRAKNDHSQNWEGSLQYEKVMKYLPFFKSAIQVPIYVIGLL
jgi:hypothetical protein